MTTPADPRRGVHAVWRTPEGNIGVCCDCRAITELVFDDTDAGRIDLPEQAFTCDTCGYSHWFTITPGTEQS